MVILWPLYWSQWWLSLQKFYTPHWNQLKLNPVAESSTSHLTLTNIQADFSHTNSQPSHSNKFQEHHHGHLIISYSLSQNRLNRRFKVLLCLKKVMEASYFCYTPWARTIGTVWSYFLQPISCLNIWLIWMLSLWEKGQVTSEPIITTCS